MLKKENQYKIKSKVNSNCYYHFLLLFLFLWLFFWDLFLVYLFSFLFFSETLSFIHKRKFVFSKRSQSNEFWTPIFLFIRSSFHKFNSRNLVESFFFVFCWWEGMKKKKKKQIQRRNFLKTHTKQSVFFNLPKNNLPKDKENNNNKTKKHVTGGENKYYLLRSDRKRFN